MDEQFDFKALEVKKKQRKVCGIKVKDGVTIVQLLFLFIEPFLLISAGDDSSTLVLPMLENKNYFKMNETDAIQW